MKALLCVLAFSCTSSLHAAADEAAALKAISRAIREGDAERLRDLSSLTGDKAARLVLDAVESKSVSSGIKAELRQLVATWPTSAPGRKTLADWLLTHANCSEDALFFFAGIRQPESPSVFWRVIEQVKGEPAKTRTPERVSTALLGLGQFEDVPEAVVSRMAALLQRDYPHLIRASAAEALGGVRHVLAVDALVPQLQDQAISQRAACGLYRLTGCYFDQQPDKQWADWLVTHRSSIPFKMYPPEDFADYLKTQAIFKPVDENAFDMDSFYGVKLEGDAILFILDVSGSMMVGSRISKLRAQMGNILTVLQNRPKRLRYGILTFSDGVDSCFQRALAPNDDDSRRKAEKFVESLQADGGTAMVAVLQHAATKVLPEGNLDTIYLLSDGEPSDGSNEMVLDAARRIKQRFQCRIHTIAIGEDQPTLGSEVTLMQQVAAITSGSFTQVKDQEDTP